ncbi:MAG: penicillin-binding protein 2 [bacterium]|nr:penicillin-binding protein 2 [bacterium]
MRFRFIIIILFFFVLYSTLVFNLYKIQIQNGKIYVAKAESQLELSGLLEPVRGNINFTDNRDKRIPAAMNDDFPFIYVVPKELSDGKEAARLLEPIIGKSVSDLEKLFSKKDDPYEPLLAKASDDQVESLKTLALTGVYVQKRPARLYPLKEVGSQIIGFVSDYGSVNGRPIGQYGIERYYNSELFGIPGTISKDVITQSKPGKSINLTIDRNVQSFGQDILAKLVKDYRAKSGSFIVQNPTSGEIIAMGALPTFDPNDYSISGIETYIDPNVQAVYEPGSVFKVVTMSAGIDTGAIASSTTYYDSGEVTLNGRTIRNADLKSHGTLTMTNVLEKSLNTGSVFAQRKTGNAPFLLYLKAFGIENITEVDLPGEISGSLGQLNRVDTRDINFATASFGQGISMTPLQLITAISTIANRGSLMRPYINSEIQPKEIRRVIKAFTADQVSNMMVSAVDKLNLATIKGYEVAGKTGTAYVPDFKRGGYTTNVINTFVGFAPASNPRFTILFKLDEPYGAPYASVTVIPAFKQLAEFLLSYYNVAPDRPTK